MKKLRFSQKITLFITALFILAVLIGPIIAPYDPLEINMKGKLQPPNRFHLFGTDAFGRDVLSRVLHGGIRTFMISAVAVFGAIAVGVPLGFCALLSPLWVAHIVRRAIEIMLSWPGIFLAMALMGVLGPGETSLVIALGAVRAPRMALMVYSKGLQLKEENFVEAARAAGASVVYIARKHLLPNIFPILLVQIVFQLASAIVSESALSFLGVGVIPPTPSWGNVIADAKSVLQIAPWFTMLSGSVIVIFVLLLNLSADILTLIITPKRR